MPPRTTLWRLKPHTRGKHDVLASYLEAWLPILAQSNERANFVDAFAGPGEYLGGEPGSPLISLRALRNHRAYPRLKDKVFFQFIEKHTARYSHLQRVLTEEGFLPSDQIEVIGSSFAETLSAQLDALDKKKETLEPSLVMIDPHGVSDTPMSVIQRILNNPKSEVYVSFMYREINRFRGTPQFSEHMDSLFGLDDWRSGIDMPEGDLRKQFFSDLYTSQLKRSNARYVVQFELHSRREHVYTIFFATSNLRGCDEMKKAIWNAAPLGDFRFRGDQANQLSLANGMVDLGQFRNQLREHFVDRYWIPIDEVVDFAMSDQTGFHSGHLKARILKPMEDDDELKVKPGTRTGSSGYPPGTILRFHDPPPKPQPQLF